MAENVITSEVRLSFVHAFKPQKNDNGEEKYGTTLLFPHPDTLSGKALEEYNSCVAALKAQANEAAIEKWGSDKTKWPKNLRVPFRDQGEKEYDGYVAGAIFMSATSKQKPGVVQKTAQGLVDIIDPSDLYSGCYARVSVRAFAYDKNGNRGIAFGLQNILKTRDGDPLSGRSDPRDDFAAIETVGGASAATAEGAGGLFD